MMTLDSGLLFTDHAVY